MTRRRWTSALSLAAGRRVVAALLIGASALSVPGALAGPHGKAATREPSFPAPARPVAPVVSPRWSTEDEREHVGEADQVIAALGPLKGLTVADIGAGEGYYEPHLSRAVGRGGHVIAEDIDTATVTKLARRVAPLGNVRTMLGRADNAGLPPDSTDLVVMVHMYHEVAQPYAMLWRLRAALRAGGRIAIVDADRQTADHGTPPRLLVCELAAIGFARQSTRTIESGIYLAVFVPRAVPATIVPCR